ncbi:GumN protein [Cellvibrio zantedeschiae]|uniref:GumN protein n=1 Tax=Cellvibrio zantedeschiae TaxID=1237077 RepID=A0ABQ3B620_9GAMM|nr:TraB/GumN family protein [Cellvibrio zantedeschiae]GGY77217.1 GumN protein [Cellvibrio zantedeschiae]
MSLVKQLIFISTILCTSGWGLAQELSEEHAIQESSADDVVEVLVVGEQPGPSLWKVYKDQHVLWVMGTISPVPKNMQWHSKQVENVVASSQEFLTQPGVKVEVGFWSKLSLLPSLVGIKHNPDGKKLVDVLPADLYARWSILKEKYIGKDNDIEKNRPIFAATELFKKSIDKSDMAPNDSVRWAIENIVRNNKIKTTKPIVGHELKNARATVKKFKKSSLDDTACFARTIERLETDLGAMRTRANAWAKGDLDALRNLPYHNEREDCESAVLNSEIAQDQGVQNIKQLLKDEWLAAAEVALATNESTFAILPMAELYKSDGYLAALAAKGYVVERPE